MTLPDKLRQQFILGRVSGIPVRADLRWVIVLALLVIIIAASIAPITGSIAVAAILALTTTLIFFLSIFLHEFAHAGVARIEGLRVIEIVLHPFGGLTRFGREPGSPREEFRIAIAGPVASLVLAMLFAALAAAAAAIDAAILFVISITLAVGNFILALFNLFPGYPLDGGRIVRAYLWRSGRNLSEATILTGRAGQAIAVLMVLCGIIAAIVRGDLFTGFWMTIVGLFLWDSASGVIKDTRRQERTVVESVMLLPVTVSPEMSIREVVDRVLPIHRQSAFPVSMERSLLGFLLLEDINRFNKEVWAAKPVRELMRPVENDHFVEVGTSLSEARELARTNRIGSVCVLRRDGILVGVIGASSSRQR